MCWLKRERDGANRVISRGGLFPPPAPAESYSKSAVHKSLSRSLNVALTRRLSHREADGFHLCINIAVWEGGGSPADQRRRVFTPKDVTESPGCDEINSKMLSKTVWAPRGREPTERVVLVRTDSVTLRNGRTNSFNMFWWISWYFQLISLIFGL